MGSLADLFYDFGNLLVFSNTGNLGPVYMEGGCPGYSGLPG